ncbi:MAG: ABC transporter permease, partial [Dehalococcoidia bacterium]
MGKYILRRVVLMIPTLIGVSLLVFFAIRLIPGDIVAAMAAEQGTITDEGMAQIRASLGLDQPAWRQYITWVTNAVQGDFGHSHFARSEPAADRIIATLPVTLELGFLAIVFAVVIGGPIGILSAMKQDSTADYAARIYSITMLSVPNFWAATLVITFGAIWFAWFPPLRYQNPITDPIGNLQQFLLPAFILSTSTSGSFMRMMRSSLLEVLRQDYIRTAVSKGLKMNTVVTKHALKNAMIPVITLLGTSIGPLIGGSVVIEAIFGLPGL